MIARSLHEPTPEVESFYHLSGCEMSGRVCEGTACFVARNARGVQRVQDEPRVYCLGRCFEAPACGLSDSRPRVEIRSREAVVLPRLAAGGARTLADYERFGGYQAIRKAVAATPGDVLDAIERSGLRGRGGAGFPTGRKWHAAAAQRSSTKYVVANGDEGDAGSYIDRFLMEDDPHALIEGMLIAAFGVGASRGWIYIRHEYPAARLAVERAIEEARRAGLLGSRVLESDFAFDLEVAPGHGSYVCGEESAMLLSIEGRRPQVMARPPYPTEHGLLGLPTVTNNIETFVNVPWIITHGGEAYAALGRSSSRGTKVLSLNSLFVRPGLYEVEFGMPVREIVEELGGGLSTGALKGVIIGGPLAGIIPPELLDTALGFEELAAIGAAVGHGGVLAFDEHTSIPALVHHIFSFGAYESCGHCTPCRLGSKRIEEIFAEVLSKRCASEARGVEWLDLVHALNASLCGHGTGLGAFAESVLRYYRKELEPCFT